MLNLSKPQRLIYEMEKYAGGSIASICGSVLVQGQRNVSELQRAASEIYRLNEALRIQITERNGEIWQDVTDYEEQPVEVLHFDSKEAFTDFAEAYAKETVPLSGPLCKIQVILLPDSYGLLAKLHHTIGDAWTLTLIASQFNEILAGRKPQAFPYSNYIERETSYTQSPRYLKDRDFFLEQYEACREVTYLSEKTGDSYTASRRTFFIEAEKAEQIREYARNHGTSPFVLFLMSFSIYFSRIKMNTERFYIGTPILNRGNFKEKNTMGMFINTVPVPAYVDYAWTFAENVALMQGTVFSVLRHQKFHYGDVLSAIRQKFGPVETLYDVILSYQNATVNGTDQNVETAWYHNGAQTESLQIHIDDRDSKGFFRIQCDYRMDRLTKCDVQKIYEHILNLLFDAIGHDTKCPAELAMLSPDEEQQLLRDFNNTAVAYPREKCIHTLFEEQVKRTPEQNAIIACDKTLTYQELNEQANQIAHGLINLGVKPGDIVAFALPRRSYLIAAMFGILKAGAAYLPVDPDYPQDRIDYMLRDSNAAYFITKANAQELIKGENSTNPALLISGSSLCYCIYTSGSTGKPKGTLLTHQNVGNYINKNYYNVLHSIIQDNYKTIVSVTTVGFDIFVTESILPLINGMTVLFANEDQSQMQTALNEFIKQYPADVLQTTPTKMRILIREPTQREYLKSLKSIILGGEAVDAALVSELGMLTSAHIFNIYGPTETTVWSTIAEIQSPDDITIGKPIANTQIYIVDKYLQLVPPSVTGELCIAGDGVGAGYLNRPELTSERFIDNPFGTGKLYKTGDLAYWREDGNIAYVGRNDFQVKIRGLRIELGEIENAIQEVEGISQAAVVVRKSEAGRQLICAFYTGQEIDSKTFRATLGQKLPKYMLPHSFTHLEAMPLTSSGKVNRKALPEVSPDCIADMVEYAAPKTEQETVLCTAVQDVLHIEKVGMADNFFDLGGDSLKSIELIAALEQAGYSTEVKTIFDTDTLGELAKYLTASEAGQEITIPTGPIPTTDAQMRVYTAQAMAGGTAYNIPYVFRVKRLDPARLQTTISKLVNRHESLRTWFENRDGQIMQIVEDSVSCAVEELDSDDISAFVRPFDLETAPLLRVGYYQNTVMIDMHHIITDGSSMPVFLRELNELYMGRTLIGNPVQYREFSIQNHCDIQSEQYWLSVYSDAPPVLEMNTDYPRKGKQTFSGAALYEELPHTLHERICTKCRMQNITPYAFYMGGFYILLSKFSGNEDIVVGIPVSGRSSRFLDSIGMFVNMLALRNKPEGSKTVSEFLKEIKNSTVSAIEFQEYPYGKLVRKLNIHTQSRNPLFDVIFAYQSDEMTDIIFEDEPVELLPVPIAVAKCDFTFNIYPRQDKFVIMVEYCTDLYKEQTIRRLLEGYRTILEQMLNDGERLADISAVTYRERQKLLYSFNDTAANYPKDKCVHTLFEEQVERTPHTIAVIACDKTLTYTELNAQANHIAYGLIEKGVRPGDIVAFALPRNSYLIPTMFGILKAGAGYLPIDPDYPQERIDYMLRDSGAKMFVRETELLELLENSHTGNLCIKGKGNKYCVIYTSGSTGIPKGCILQHQGVCNFCINSNVINHFKKYGIEPVGVSINNVTFDYFIAETVPLLLHGYTAVLCNEEQSIMANRFWDVCERYHVNLIQTTPTKYRLMLNDPGCKYLKHIDLIVTSGEPLTKQLIRALKKHTQAVIFNPLGPSETTIWSPNGEVIYCEDIHIGKPLTNTQCYIVDKNLYPIPIGVTGELCIAGDGVGAGYLNRPELTAEKFIENPFGSGKLYKTGDLAYWREDGNIVYIGRNDFQVKIRGLRIELGEIENAIQEVEGVSQATVVVRKNEEGRQLICAFYTGQEIDSKAFRTAIGQKLPKYMLPHSFTHLEAMPLTSSGKVNRKALPEVDLCNIANVVEYVPPVGEIEMRLASLMEQVLDYSPIGRDDDFFDLGGDSLKAIEFLSTAHSEGIYFSLQSLFDHPTVNTLRTSMEDGDSLNIFYEPIEFTEINRLLAKNREAPSHAPSQKAVGNLLLTGATGFLGIHILEAFLKSDAGTAYCLVRGEDKTASEKRLAELMEFYFGDEYRDLLGKRIQVICGDLGEDSFGLSEHTYHELLECVDTVINAAACVKHYGSYQYFYEVNVESTKRLVSFCQTGHAKLIHISTLSVSGNSFDTFDGYVSETEKHFDEGDLYIEQQLKNVYARSKFEAEKIVLEAMLDGLHANIMRMGNLTNRFSDGKFQINYESNASAKRVKGMIELGAIPDYLIAGNMYMEFTPIDEAARAVMTIVRHFSKEQTVFHINSTKVVYMDKLLEHVNKLGYPMKTVSGTEFATTLRNTAKETGREHILQIFINDLDENDRLNYDSNIRIEEAITEDYLKQLGFEWSEIGLEYLQRYTEYFRQIGYWKV